MSAPQHMPPAWELYLVRHALAEERGPAWPDDRLRPLTGRGEARFRAVVAGLRRFGVGLDEIVTSPLARTAQTAALLAAGIGGTPPVRRQEMLAPGHAPAEALAAIAGHAAQRRVALVGHEPDLGKLAAHLIGASRPLPFRKGGVCRIDVASPASPRGTLVWFATPRLLRALAK